MGCLGNRVSLQVRATIVAGQAVTRGELGSFVSGTQREWCNLKCIRGNYRSSKLVIICAMLMYDNIC